MTRALHLDPASPGCTILAASPADYLLGAGYAHIPRSAHILPGGRAIATAWCGPSFCVSPGGRARWTDDITGRRLCGTCLGRHAGYYHIATPDGHTTAFNPTRTLTSLEGRRWCPSRGLWIPDHNSYRFGSCLLCGFHGSIRLAPSRYGQADAILVRHPPASRHALVHCPSCGWRHLHIANDHIFCAAFRCTFAIPLPRSQP